MTPDQTTLAKQLAALPGFRWGEGMLSISPGAVIVRCVVLASDTDPAWGCCNAGNEWPMGEEQDLLPDLTDAATGGVLLGWLAKMGLGPNADRNGHEWSVGAFHIKGDEFHEYGAPTLAEACARALIAVGRCA